MFDIATTLTAIAYAVLALAGITAAVAVAGIVVALRDLRSTSTPVLVTVAGPAERTFTRAA